MGQRPFLKFFSASSRSACERSPWIEVTGYPAYRYRYASRLSAPRFVSTKISVRDSAAAVGRG